jgi:hypothetical protein
MGVELRPQLPALAVISVSRASFALDEKNKGVDLSIAPPYTKANA